MSERNRSSGYVPDPFSDTSVLFNYALDADDERAATLIVEHPCQVIVSETVTDEFDAVRSRRQAIHEALLDAVLEGSLDQFDPEVLSELSSNDREYLEAFRRTLSTLDPEEALRRVRERVRQLNRGAHLLFKEGYVEVASTDSPSPMLRGNLESVIENGADVQVVCDAVAHHRTGGDGVFLSADRDDILGAAVESGTDSDGGGLPETFGGFVDRGERPNRSESTTSYPAYLIGMPASIFFQFGSTSTDTDVR